MGWGKFLGDLAKDFAAGYIEERGVKGTIDDLKSLASGLHDGLDSQETDEDDDWNEFHESVMELIDDGEYLKALTCLDNYYNKHDDGEADVVYFDIRSQILTEYLESEIGSADFYKIRDALVKAIQAGRSFEDDDYYDEFNEYEERCEAALESHRK